MPNIQLHPTRKIVVPNDRASKRYFVQRVEDYKDRIAGKFALGVLEMKKHPKYKDLETAVVFSIDPAVVAKDPSVTEVLGRFDNDVANVCISEWEAGNRYTTPAIIYRAITGKVGRGDAEPSKNQLTDILNSLKVLMRLQIDYDLSTCCKQLGYNNGKPEHLISALLPAYYLQASTINGKDATVIAFDRESPLLQAAKIKNNQILSFDSNLLDVPHQQNTRMNISIKFYVLTRVLEVKLHKQLTPTVTFDDVFNKCRITNASRKTKHDAREIVMTLFEHLQEKEIIQSFELNKQKNASQNVKFSVSKATT